MCEKVQRSANERVDDNSSAFVWLRFSIYECELYVGKHIYTTMYVDRILPPIVNDTCTHAHTQMRGLCLVVFGERAFLIAC